MMPPAGPPRNGETAPTRSSAFPRPTPVQAADRTRARPAAPGSAAALLFEAEAAELRAGLLRLFADRRPGSRRRAPRRPGVPSAADPSEFAHVALLRAAERLDRFRGDTPGQLHAWVRAIGKNVLRDAVRVRRGGFAALTDDLPDPHGDPLDELVAADVRAWLDALVAGLPAAEHHALRLTRFDGLTAGQAAGRLGRTEAAVAGLLKRGLARLRGRAGRRLRSG